MRRSFAISGALASWVLIACVSDSKSYVVVPDDGGQSAATEGGASGDAGGGGGDTEGGAAIDASGPVTKIVFITRDAHAGDLGGLAGADAICAAAAKGNLTGTFKAWLSDGAAAPLTRFDASAKAELVGTDGASIATGFSDLLAAGAGHGIQSKIDHDEAGAQLMGSNIPVWTNVNPDGNKTGDASAPADHCAGWTAAGTTGAVGNAADITAGHWTAAGGAPASCATPAHLYCFEQ
jgi:hypothetical protein